MFIGPQIGALDKSKEQMAGLLQVLSFEDECVKRCGQSDASGDGESGLLTALLL